MSSNHSALNPNEVAIPIQGAAEATSETAEQGIHKLMYKAANEGDWARAEPLVKGDVNLNWQQISESGDLALHIAVRKKHIEFVKGMVRHTPPSNLVLKDGNGYSACCYAAIDGDVELIRIFMDANPSVLDSKNRKGTTPFELLVTNGKPETFSHFLDVISIEKTAPQWNTRFHLLIKKRMFDVALKFVEKKEWLVVTSDDQYPTALHILAALDMSRGWKVGGRVKTEADFDLLAASVWSILKKMGSVMVLELVKGTIFPNDRIIPYEAAKAGNLKIINMIIDDFPQLLSRIDSTGCSLLHIIVMHRQHNDITDLINKAKGIENDGVISVDEDGNNILHAAAKSIYPEGLETIAEQDFEMKRAFTLFKKVEEIVHPDNGEMRNNEGYRPIDLFWKEHAQMLSTSETYLKRTSESCMLISTIVLTLVFAAAFAPPGGFHEDSGIPIHLKNKWFTSFIVFEILAMTTSTFSIIGFWSIIVSKTKEYQFFVWPRYLRYSMCALLLSVFFVISAFLSTFMLVFVRERRAVAMSFILLIYVTLFVVISYQVVKVLRKTNHHSLMDSSSSKSNNLWGRVYDFGASILSSSGSSRSSS